MLSEERVTRFLVIGLLLAIAILLSGWSYVLVYKPQMIFSTSSGGSTFISSEQLEEGTIEALIVGLVYVLGLVGLYWFHSIWSRGRSSSPEIIVAVVLIIISVVSLYWLGTYKGLAI